MACFNIPDVSILVYVLIAIFAISSWVDIVGLWVELPLMVNKLPERWSLPSYMALVIQLANIGPAVYSIILKIYSEKSSSSRNDSAKEIYLAFIIISTEIVSTFLMSFFWDFTIIVGGKSRSIPMLILLCCSSLCSCLSSVVFLPYMARFSVHYLSAYYLGNGLSGLIPGLTGLVQGLGGEPKCINSTLPANESIINLTASTLKFKLVPEYPPPKFSVQAYLICICCLLIASLVSFYCLNFSRLRNFQIVLVQHDESNKTCNFEEGDGPLQSDQLRESKSNGELLNVEPEILQRSSTFKLAFYLTMVALLNASTNGLIPSIQSYACLPYGNVVYSLSVRMSSVVGALSSLSTMFLPRPNEKAVACLTSTGLGMVIYQLVLALQSPHPVLQYHIAGSILVVLSSLVMSACFSFVRVSVASVLHSFGGRRALLWCGGVTQVGSFCGATVGFALVNWTSLFTSIKPCTDQL